jgi:hypothetical protein
MYFADVAGNGPACQAPTVHTAYFLIIKTGRAKLQSKQKR